MAELNVYVNRKYSDICVKFNVNDNTTIRDFWHYVYTNTFQGADNCVISDDQYYRLCCFVTTDGTKRGILDYEIIKFLDNFNIDYKNVEVSCSDAFGIGGDFTIDNSIKIQINANEPRHNNPHVHVTRPYKHDNYYRIDINSMDLLDGNEREWKAEFNLKERKTILKVISDNKEKLIDYYNRNRKGEYIKEVFSIEFEGQQIVIK